MALAHLTGSQGNFGQAKISSRASTVAANSPNSVLVMTEDETALLVELLSNTIHQRGKEGPGGYSAATFSFKYLICALRCLLTHSLNQSRMSDVAGRKLNMLLMKVLAQHSLDKSSTVDAETAEWICFSLYLQSNYGFKVRNTKLAEACTHINEFPNESPLVFLCCSNRFFLRHTPTKMTEKVSLRKF